MKLREIKSKLLDEKYYVTEHQSGLKIFVYPKKGYNSTYVLLGTKYGSINTEFSTSKNSQTITVPAGTAHFLEHKMFESQEGDAFAHYAKTGASANAYTAFDKTCYLFSCTENFEESLKILLKFVQTPYFTKETVAKEQGIIGQEIKMYEDDSDWRVLFNLLGAMYNSHPVKIDIAGTVESIAKITPEKLYECYNAFYNPNNMAICIAGDVDENDVLDLLEKNLKCPEKVEAKTFYPHEDYKVAQNYVEQKFPISSKIFNLGFKEMCSEGQRRTEKEHAETDILLEILASKSSSLYSELLDLDLINTASFGYEYFCGPGYSSIIFSGETKDPDMTAKIIKNKIDTLKKNGIDKESFERAKKSIYGKDVSMFNSVDTIANAIVDLEFSNNEIFSYIECLSNVTIEDVSKRFTEQLDTNNCSLSVILPKEE